MVEFLWKYENRGIKIAPVNSIRIAKSINLLQFCMVLGVCCDVDIFILTSVRSPLIEKSMVGQQAIDRNQPQLRSQRLQIAHKQERGWHILCLHGSHWLMQVNSHLASINMAAAHLGQCWGWTHIKVLSHTINHQNSINFATTTLKFRLAKCSVSASYVCRYTSYVCRHPSLVCRHP